MATWTVGKCSWGAEIFPDFSRLEMLSEAVVDSNFNQIKDKKELLKHDIVVSVCNIQGGDSGNLTKLQHQYCHNLKKFIYILTFNYPIPLYILFGYVVCPLST